MNSPPVASRRPRPRGRPSRIRLWHVSLARLATGLVLLAIAVCSLSAATSDQDRLLVDGAPVRAWVVEAPADSGFDLPGTYRPANSIPIS